MVKVFEGTEKEYSVDGYLVENLKLAKKVVKKDWDMVFLVDGYEGTGKSVLAMQMGFYCDPTLNLSRITFTPEEFENAVLTAESFQAVIYDEAYTGLSSRSTMSNINQTIVRMLAEIRQKNLFIFIVMPTFFDLDKYVAIWRSRALLHVKTEGNFERGFFKFYNMDRKKSLYVNGKKFYNYNNPKPNFFGRFSGFYPIDKEGYKEKKRKSLVNKKPSRFDKELTAVYRAFSKFYSQTEIARLVTEAGFKISQKSISNRLDTRGLTSSN